MFNKVVYILISLRGDSKSMRYVVTNTTHNVEIYILIYGNIWGAGNLIFLNVQNKNGKYRQKVKEPLA